MSYTSVADITGGVFSESRIPITLTVTGFVAYILTTLPPSKLKNRIFRLQGDRASLNDLGAQFKTSVEHLDRIPGDAGALKTELLSLLGSGAGSTGWDEANKVEKTGNDAAGSANGLWSDHRWRSIREVHNL